MADEIIFSTRASTWSSDKLQWVGEPNKFEITEILTIWPKTGHDLWRRTFYTPEGPGSELVKDNAPGLCLSSSEDMLIIETKIKVDAINKFDQGGIYIRFDQEHWLKTGLEYVDGEFKLSCVVTNEFSDWSTQSWSSGELRLRVFRQKHSYVVEYHDGSDWVFFRITHINSGTLEGQFGVYCATPTQSDGRTSFNYLKIYKHTGHSHTT